jgi:hypothetical protein
MQQGNDYLSALLPYADAHHNRDHGHGDDGEDKNDD